MWALYALLSAFFAATLDPLAKTALKTSDEYLIGWFTLFISSLFLAFPFFACPGFTVHQGLIKALLMAMPFEVFAAVFYYRALKLTDISLAAPFLALTPLFTILIAYLMIGERIRSVGALGIVLISMGVYSINIKEAKYGIFHPLKAIFSNKGTLYMAIVAVVFSFTAVISKKAMLYASPQTIPFIYNLSITLVMSPLIFYRLKTGRSVLRKDRKTALSFLALGFTAALSAIFYFKSIALTDVAYAISLKRLSLLLSVGYGFLLFKERDIHVRLISTACMVLGAALIFISK